MVSVFMFSIIGKKISEGIMEWFSYYFQRIGFDIWTSREILSIYAKVNSQTLNRNTLTTVQSLVVWFLEFCSVITRYENIPIQI